MSLYNEIFGILPSVAKFSKVSLQQFTTDVQSEFGITYTPDEIEAIYDSITLPRRATKGSAGYDIFSPFRLVIKSGQTAKVPTGIRVAMTAGWFFAIFPRSGMGFKTLMRLGNTVGIVDQDFWEADNEGHIHIKLVNSSEHKSPITIQQGKAFAQGVFMPFGITVDDDTDGERVGGFGSTDAHE